MSEPLNTEAVVLRTIDYSDTSLIVRLFTEEYGKVTVMARGAKRPKQSTAAELAPPNHVRIIYAYKSGRDIQTLTRCELASRFGNLATDLRRSAAALLAVEMLDRSVHDADPHAILFRLIVSYLTALDAALTEPAVLVHFYQYHLADQLGFEIRLDRCPKCDRPIIDARFSSTSGDLFCTRCWSAGGLRLSTDQMEYLRALRATHITRLDACNPGGNVKKEVGNFLLKYLFYHVDEMEKLRSLEFWNQVNR